MAFLFRFSRLKAVRELEEDLAQQRLALAKQEELRQEEKLQAAREQESSAFLSFSQPRFSEAISLELDFRQCHELAYRSAQQLQVRIKASEQVAEDRDHLIMRMQKAKIMQSLYDRHHETWQIEDAQAEQRVLDELGGMQYLRNSKTGR